MTITGTIRNLESGMKVWKNFRLSIEKVPSRVADDFVKEGEQLLKEWRYALEAALGDWLAPEYWHRQRPYAETKKFPYANTGNQLMSIETDVMKKVTGQGNFSITGHAKLPTYYALYTTAGQPARKDPPGKVGWVGWLDDVFYAEGGREYVMSVSDVFEKLVSERDIIGRNYQ